MIEDVGCQIKCLSEQLTYLLFIFSFLSILCSSMIEDVGCHIKCAAKKVISAIVTWAKKAILSVCNIFYRFFYSLNYLRRRSGENLGEG